MAAKKGFEDFGAVFGEATAEWDPECAAYAVAPSLRPFLYHAHAPDHSCLEVMATDFHSLTFARVLSANDLEDLRDDIGIGGSWPEFLDYLKSSLSAVHIKLILGGLQNGDSSGRASLIALKSKGLPRISLALNKISDVLANNTMAKLSLALYRAFTKNHSDALKEQHRSLHLMESLSSERERNDNLKKQLDSLPFLSKRKAPMPKSSGAFINASETALDSGLQQPTEAAATKSSSTTKISQRGALVSRRPRVRGVSLHDIEEDDDGK